MIESPTRSHSVIGGYEALRPLLGSLGPVELATLREAAFARFAKKGFPTPKDEEFRFTSLRPIAETEFSPSYGATVTAEELKPYSAFLANPRIVFVNGQYAPELSDLRGLQREATVSPLDEALQVQPGRVMAHLAKIASLDGKLGSTNDERLCDLNTAHIGEGAYIEVPMGVVAEEPIQVVFVSRADHGAFVSHPRVVIALGDNAQAKVVETYIGLGGTYWTNAVTEVRLGESAILEHTRAQLEAPEAFHTATVAAHQEGSSVWTSNIATFGGHISRIDVNLWLNGEHTESWLNGAYLGTGHQLQDHHTRIDHAKPNCNSFEVYKGVLSDRARGVFNGKIFVYEDAQKTDAKQTNQVLLLSKTAAIDTKPQLEIFADDVKCTHGATVGQLREDALFYLRARGIPERDARAILVRAFVNEVLDKVSVAPVREELEAIMKSKLGGSSE